MRDYKEIKSITKGGIKNGKENNNSTHYIYKCFLALNEDVSFTQFRQLSIGTATVGGIFYNIGSPVAQCVNKALPELNITAEITEGSVENLRLMGRKRMHLAIITPQIGYFARKGMAMFKDNPVDFGVIVRLLPNAKCMGCS